MQRQDRLTTLGLLWAAWDRQGRTLAAEQWDRPTRLGGWTVRMLYAHAAGWPLGFSRLVGQVRETEPTHATAAALLGAFNALVASPAARPTGSPRPPGRTRRPPRRRGWWSSSR